MEEAPNKPSREELDVAQKAAASIYIAQILAKPIEPLPYYKRPPNL